MEKQWLLVIKMVKWTREQEIYALRSKRKGYSINKISKLMKKRYGVNRKYHSIYTKINKLEKKNTIIPKVKSYMKHAKYTQEQIDFVHLCKFNGMPLARISLAFYEQFGIEVNLRQINYLFYRKVPADERLFSNAPAIQKELAQGKLLQELEKPTKKPKTKAPKRYTKKEIALISSCKSAKDAEKLSSILKRSKDALNRQWYYIKEKETMSQDWETKSKKKAKPTVKKNIQSVQEEWNKFKDLDLLINFYDLSIDEAKARYGFSYEIIAGRLEHLINSNNPDNIALVIEATRAVNERKSQQPTETKPSRRQLRKERKMAKKEARQKKRIERMEKRLKKLRGEKK
tara:strand:+ start:69 stop:1100 length:1032 start_codon:yes stop_codon:yes gene_type:complete